MRITVTAVITAAAACLAGCSDPPAATPPVVRLSHDIRTDTLEAADIERRLLDQAWVEAADEALDQPTVVELPYAEWGGFLGSEPGARGFAFAGSEGQVVKVALARPDANDSAVVVDGNVRVELFLVQTRNGEIEHVRLAEIPAGEPALWFRLPAGASYVVRVQPEPRTDALYRLSVELEAALPFPVKGRADGAVGSLFGMPRDAGARHHEGIDIFAPRSTPVLAVADGRATPRENKLGGNTVWLSTPGTSYYYAHLERAAVTEGQRVRAGDVIGYVGNSGNAVTTDPHLHFGIYRWGKGAVDPFPLLQARRFTEPPAGNAPESRLVLASLKRGCTAPRVIHAAGYGCSMRMGNAVEGLSAAAAADCVQRGANVMGTAPPREPPQASHTFQWTAAEPLSLDEDVALIVPVDFDPAGAAMAASELRDADGSLLACELAKGSEPTRLRAAARPHANVIAF